ncbi:hypothetical protein AB0K14_38155 [Actinosynnema sp. NPDC050801]|uniref:hypothetical protein n=1 Tax=unclassified Actinosynnema TaxID=2637065 RepID=UPI0033DFCDBF
MSDRRDERSRDRAARFQERVTQAETPQDVDGATTDVEATAVDAVRDDAVQAEAVVVAEESVTPELDAGTAAEPDADQSDEDDEDDEAEGVEPEAVDGVDAGNAVVAVNGSAVEALVEPAGSAGNGTGEVAEAVDSDERVFTRARTPELPDDADISILDPEVKQELRGLPKGLADIVGRHLAAAGMLIDSEPELALEHARYARSKAARVAVVREAAGLAAYHAGEWAEALSELRAARRMSNSTGHVAVMADCERALGRPERAIELAREAQVSLLSPDEAVELRIVAAGARRDMGQLDAAVVALQGDDLDEKRRDPWSARLFYAYADNLEAAGRTEEAVKWFLNAAQADDDNETDAAERAFDISPQD